jgi:hypothetical protein
MAKPARPELIYRSIDDMLADVDRLKSGPYDKAGQWDLPMILDHLAKAMNSFLPGAKPLPWPVNVVARVGVHLMAKRTYYPGIKWTAPKSMTPPSGIPLEQAEPEFRTAAEKIKSFTGEKIEGTPFGAISREDLLKLHLLHGAHHLSFLRPV